MIGIERNGIVDCIPPCGKRKFSRSFTRYNATARHTHIAVVPPAELVPAQIASYVEQNYKGAAIVQIDRDTRDYEVKLTNGLELTFDLRFNIIDIDD